MKINRIYGVVIRNIYTMKKNYEEVAEMFFWPSVDLLLWGITAFFMKTMSPEFGNILIMIVTGLIFWHIVWRNQYEMNWNLLKEMWNDNLINLFGTPLKFSEWVVANLFLGFTKMVIGFSFVSMLAYILYKVNIFSLGFYILPFTMLLMMSGWCIGFLMVGFIMRYGQRVQIFAWGFAAIISPFAAIYYPVSILPHWAQMISKAIPMSYIFEGMREVVITGNFNIEKVLTSFILNVSYIILAIIYLNFSFKKILKKGLIKAT